jgi:hypothetical protein
MSMSDPRVRAVEAYVQAVRTGAPSAAERAGQYLSASVVLVARPLELVGRDAVLRRITGQWPWTSTYGLASWSDPRPDGDRLTVHAEFPPMGASPASVDLAFTFDAEDRVARVDQVTVMQGAPPPPPTDTMPRFVRGIVNGALANGTPMVLSYVDEDGQPSLSLRGSVHVYDDVQLSLWVRNSNGGLIRSLRVNPSVALLYRDSKTRTTLIFRGHGRVETDEPVRDRVFTLSPEVEQNHDPERTGAAVLVEVYSLQGTSPRGPVRMERSAPG